MKKLEVSALGVFSVAVLPLRNINLPWDYSNGPVRSKACGQLNLECFVSDWISWLFQCQEGLQACSVQLARHWGDYLHPKALKLKNSMRQSWLWRTAAPVIIRKLNWINKTSNNCHTQMLKAGSLGKCKANVTYSMLTEIKYLSWVFLG